MRGAEVRVHVLDDGNDDAMTRPGRAATAWATSRRAEHTGAKAGQHQPRADEDERPVHRRVRLGPRGRSGLPRGDARVDGGTRDRVRPDTAVLRQHRAQPDRRRVDGRSRRCSSVAICRGKDGLGAVFCCGTNVLFRREAFESVGGFPTNSLTEDFELSIHLHEKRMEVGLHPGRALARRSALRTPPRTSPSSSAGRRGCSVGRPAGAACASCRIEA